MDIEMNGKLIHMHSNKRDLKHNTHQETRSMIEEHTSETIILMIVISFSHVIVLMYFLVYTFYYVFNVRKLDLFYY